MCTCVQCAQNTLCSPLFHSHGCRSCSRLANGVQSLTRSDMGLMANLLSRSQWPRDCGEIATWEQGVLYPLQMRSITPFRILLGSHAWPIRGGAPSFMQKVRLASPTNDFRLFGCGGRHVLTRSKNTPVSDNTSRFLRKVTAFLLDTHPESKYLQYLCGE